MTKASDEFCDRLRAARLRLVQTTISDPALAVCIAGLARVEQVLRRPLRVVIIGEYNSGKTSVADLLIGHGLLPTSVVSNTQVPVLISYAEAAALYGVDRNDMRIRIDGDADDPLTDVAYRALQLTLPLDRLRGYHVLDTPALVNPAAFVADADIVIWCTVATRAWTESERAAWTALPQRCFRNALLVATHKDGLMSEHECAQVTSRLRALTAGLFRDVVLVAAEGAPEGQRESLDEADGSGAEALRAAVSSAADAIVARRLRKAERIVRRLARLTFHEFASGEVRPDSVMLMASWEAQARVLVEQMKQGRKSVPATIEDLLVLYAHYAEMMRPGVVTGDSIPSSETRALTAPMRWPAQTSAAAHLVTVLASDLTGLLRMISGTSIYADPAVRREYKAARGVLLSLADLDGAFDALGRLIGAPMGSGAA